MKKTLNKFLSEYKQIKVWKLLYKVRASKFHEKCDNVPNTVTIVKSANGFVFGGFTTKLCNSVDTYGYKKDENAFLFSLVNAKSKPYKFSINPHEYGFAICCHSRCGPTFGSGHDLHIFDNAEDHSSELGNTYDCLGVDSQFLASSSCINVAEIEVFGIDFKF